MPSSADGSAPARTALVGNPSDGYGGAVLSVTLPELGAHAHVVKAGHASSTPPSVLVDAVANRFATEHETPPCAIDWSTTVPEGVGLGGSSAIAIAVIRALCGLYGVELSPDEIAALALAVEREDLGIAGGRQDQITEAYGGLVLMDFGREHHERLDPTLLPPLVIGWRTDCAEASGVVHSTLRERHRRGDAVIHGAITELTALTFTAREALEAGDREAFARCVDRSYDLRAEMVPLDSRHVAMVQCARATGAAANYTGSGGAVVAVCEHDAHQVQVAEALAAAGCGVLTPRA